MTPNYLFIGGLHRSGTSLLHRMLAEHPWVTGFASTGVPEDEGQHLQSVFPTAKAHGGPGFFAFDPAAHLTETSPLITEANRARLLGEWEKHWDTTKPWRIEKSPPNIIRGRFLRAMFPACRLVYIVRHPVAVSFATLKWTQQPIPDLFRHWAEAHRIMQEDRAQLGDTLLIRYEDMAANPQGTLAEITDWLGLPPHTTTEQVMPDVNAHYFTQFQAWQQEHKAEAEALLRDYATPTAQFGYSLLGEGGVAS